MTHLSVSRVIDAPPERVYNLIADYKAGHPRILPKAYFKELVVEQGGVGAGTVARVLMAVGGTEFRYRLTVTEPQPGRVLMEEDLSAGVTTTFTVDPLEGGARSNVTIATTWQAQPGLRGWLQARLTPLFARSIYRQELDLLAQTV